MSADPNDRRALAFSALVAAGVLVLGLQMTKTVSAFEALEDRHEASGPSHAPGNTASGAGNPNHAPSAEDLEVTETLRALSGDLAGIRRDVEGRRPIRGSGHGEDVSSSNLQAAVQETLATMRREKVEQMAASMAKAMRGGGVHTMEMNAKFMQLSDDQVKEMTKVFDEETERCRVLLLNTDHHDPDYQRQAQEIIERTDARIGAIMTEEQRVKFKKIGADFFGPGLDYERKAKPK
ncbi:MAG: hypothetical protein K8T20_10520 [Planctomycetes bacterium]|nr:hypothetical protein [Planctomycetota bacterium]